jgi:hypothetical protein
LYRGIEDVENASDTSFNALIDGYDDVIVAAGNLLD